MVTAGEGVEEQDGVVLRFVQLAVDLIGDRELSQGFATVEDERIGLRPEGEELCLYPTYAFAHVVLQWYPLPP